MKDFDQARQARAKSEDERTFRIGGEVFVVKQSVPPETFARWDDLTEKTNARETLEIIDEMLVNMVEDRDDAHARYYRLRQRVEDPLTSEDLQDLTAWLVESLTGRPTGQPSGSGSGQRSTGTPSTEGSSSPGIRAA